MSLVQDYIFGIPLTTHRNRELENSPFLYEAAIAAISICFFRTTIYQKQEPELLRWFFALMLAFLAYSNKSYELICAVEIFSYAVPFLLHSNLPHRLGGGKDSKLLRLLLIALSAFISLIACHFTASGDLFHILRFATPNMVHDTLSWLFPIAEVQAAYDIMDHFVMEPNLFRAQCARLLFVTFHCQVGIGYLGIHFLTKEQERRNVLVRMDMVSDDDEDDDNDESTKDSNTSVNGKKEKKNAKSVSAEKKLKRSQRFQRTAAPFILMAAVPYMVQIIFYGNINSFAFTCFKDDMHRAVRLYDLFEDDNHMVAMANHSPKSPGGTSACIYVDPVSFSALLTFDIMFVLACLQCDLKYMLGTCLRLSTKRTNCSIVNSSAFQKSCCFPRLWPVNPCSWRKSFPSFS
jgi:hypothetical protein